MNFERDCCAITGAKVDYRLEFPSPNVAGYTVRQPTNEWPCCRTLPRSISPPCRHSPTARHAHIAFRASWQATRHRPGVLHADRRQLSLQKYLVCTGLGARTAGDTCPRVRLLV